MALIKCRECGKDVSEYAKMCPHCGIENDIIVCPECGKPLSSKITTCPNCGYGLKKYEDDVDDIDISSGFEYSDFEHSGFESSGFKRSRPQNLGLAIAGFVCSAVSILLINPLGLFSLLGIIFGGIAVSTNPKEEGEWHKFIWNFENKARGFGFTSLFVGTISLVYYVINLLLVL